MFKSLNLIETTFEELKTNNEDRIKNQKNEILNKFLEKVNSGCKIILKAHKKQINPVNEIFSEMLEFAINVTYLVYYLARFLKAVFENRKAT